MSNIYSLRQRTDEGGNFISTWRLQNNPTDPGVTQDTNPHRQWIINRDRNNRVYSQNGNMVTKWRLQKNPADQEATQKINRRAQLIIEEHHNDTIFSSGTKDRRHIPGDLHTALVRTVDDLREKNSSLLQQEIAEMIRIPENQLSRIYHAHQQIPTRTEKKIYDFVVQHLPSDQRKHFPNLFYVAKSDAIESKKRTQEPIEDERQKKAVQKMDIAFLLN
jgi:hypothetical protein